MTKLRLEKPGCSRKTAGCGVRCAIMPTPRQTTPGQACEMVRRTRPAWSVGYRILSSRQPTPQEAARGVRRVILRWEIIELSPVANPGGSGVGTLEVACG